MKLKHFTTPQILLYTTASHNQTIEIVYMVYVCIAFGLLEFRVLQTEGQDVLIAP